MSMGHDDKDLRRGGSKRARARTLEMGSTIMMVILKLTCLTYKGKRQRIKKKTYKYTFKHKKQQLLNEYD